jgi:hypothetical protein
MQRAATEVMQAIIFSAVLDGIAALKRASGGLPNQLLRDVQAIHANVTFADLPKELQDAIAETTRTAFTQLLQQSRPIDRVPERDRRGPPRGPGQGHRRGGRPPKGGGNGGKPGGGKPRG